MMQNWFVSKIRYEKTMENGMVKKVTEKWMKIPEFGGFYSISNIGRVSSCMSGKVKIKKLQKNSDGYLTVKLGSGKSGKIYRIHRLVAGLFLGDISGMEINHIDGNKENNTVSNLEICTHKQNMYHAFNVLHINNSGMKGRFGKLHHLSKAVFQIDINGNIIQKFDSLMDASRLLNLSVANISSVARGKAHTCGGFKWSFDCNKYDNNILK